MGILNSLRHFFAPAFAPIFLNISIIFSVLFLYNTFEKPVMTLAVVSWPAGFFSFSSRFLSREEGHPFPVQLQFPASGDQENRSLMVPGLIGRRCINSTSSSTPSLPLSSQAGVSPTSSLQTGDGVPSGDLCDRHRMASLPSLSGLAARGKTDEMKETLLFTFRLVCFISFPAMVG